MGRLGSIAAAGACALVAVAACGSDDSNGAGGGDNVKPEVAWPLLTCDPLVPEYCGYPFPSNVYTVPDEGTPTGRRVQFAREGLATTRTDVRPDPEPWSKSDGFSTGSLITAQLPGATSAGLNGWKNIEASLGEDSPTVIIDAETGEKVPHWAELDANSRTPEDLSITIRPAARLKDGTRYIVAIRSLQNEAGELVASSPAFAALRDGTKSEEASVEQRRGLYADIFQRLSDAGVQRDSLQLAWDFTTASKENNTSWMVHMRDEALSLIGNDPEYAITSVESDYENDHIAYRIFGTFKAPLYLTDPGPGGDLVFGDDGLPEPNPDQPWYDVEFELLIPNSAAAGSPAKLLQYGHGLLGSKTQIESGHFREFIDQYNYAIFGVDMDGMASEDEDFVTNVLVIGDWERMDQFFDRQHQGMINQLLAMRVLKTAVASDPTYGELLNGDEAYYHGISQGGIFGGTYMALSTDVSRGVLGVMGMPYNLLLYRSVDFDPFVGVMNITWPDARDRLHILNLTQMLWDRTEPNGYAPYVRENLLPDTPAHEVLMRSALGDHQVTTLGAHIMARSIGTKHVRTGQGAVYGLEEVDGATDGSSYVEYDLGLPEMPPCNIPMRACDDPHGKIRKLDEARQQLDLFLRTGETRVFCENASCSFPELSGCDPGEMVDASKCK